MTEAPQHFISSETFMMLERYFIYFLFLFFFCGGRRVVVVNLQMFKICKRLGPVRARRSKYPLLLLFYNYYNNILAGQSIFWWK